MAMRVSFFRARRDAPQEPDEKGAEVARLHWQVAALQAEIQGLQMRFDLIRRASGEGLWDMEVPADDAAGAGAST